LHLRPRVFGQCALPARPSGFEERRGASHYQKYGCEVLCDDSAMPRELRGFNMGSDAVAFVAFREITHTVGRVMERKAPFG